jgi:hypothetical protein
MDNSKVRSSGRKELQALALEGTKIGMFGNAAAFERSSTSTSESSTESHSA